MYIPNQFAATDTADLLAFMKHYSFATIVTAKDNVPLATHLPFAVSTREDKVVLTSHFAKANTQWRQIVDRVNLVIFSEPHAYISPTHYDNEQSVPTWNYVAVHAYGAATIINDREQAFEALEKMIDTYEEGYRKQWAGLSQDYKLRMLNGIVPFDIVVTDLQGSRKLSQNKTEQEQQRIINTLSASTDGAARQIADYMRGNPHPGK
ncbi:FMN-binding negative transcriptional regulator [Parachryseolinea silvisoli]|jgi:transcriptional regulator|uniref:FMN-binding negative transcriptional regulator n=1 Tax=Parachryseolinea silvisoli TaxID=2873601 RepID=UPI002265E177|nr:FMN-binding negative transcriptional regulator [Parachryseolinea silvisoli]MCD9014701.1 FMN-binding negative transcriptional regulator [Parachryseolinea silvisoli]